jgi:hypothetical protein
MKIMTVAGIALLVGLVNVKAQGARLQIDHLERLASQAAESVNITLDPSMLKLASAFLPPGKDQAALKEMLAGVQGIYVRSLEFERENVYTPDDVNTIRKQLASPGWSKLATVDSKRERELVEIYSWREGNQNQSGGLAILVAEPMELTVINIVGPFDLEKLAALQGNFGIPRIPGGLPPAGR